MQKPLGLSGGRRGATPKWRSGTAHEPLAAGSAEHFESRTVKSLLDYFVEFTGKESEGKTGKVGVTLSFKNIETKRNPMFL